MQRGRVSIVHHWDIRHTLGCRGMKGKHLFGDFSGPCLCTTGSPPAFFNSEEEEERCLLSRPSPLPLASPRRLVARETRSPQRVLCPHSASRGNNSGVVLFLLSPSHSH